VLHLGRWPLRDYLKSPDRNRVSNRIAIEQLIIALGISIILLAFVSINFALSAAIAGAISAFSSWYSGRKIFNSNALTSEQFVQNVFLAESLKLILVLALFCVVFMLIKINFIVFIVTYALTLSAYAYEMFKTTKAEPTTSQLN
jgi:F0F1-type ATP synthase assembly protein I